jgi:hypothetical protein
MPGESDHHREVLEYATPQARKRKEAMDYYREPPAISRWTANDFVIWAGSVVAVIGLMIWYLS